MGGRTRKLRNKARRAQITTAAPQPTVEKTKNVKKTKKKA